MAITDFSLQLSELPERIKNLKAAYLKVKPSLAINRAKAFTEVTKNNQGLPEDQWR